MHRGPSSPTLTCDRFLMRPVTSSDLSDLAAIWADPEVTRYLPSQGRPIPLDRVVQSLTSFEHHWQERGYGIWAIVDRAGSPMLGYCGLRALDEVDEVELLYGLGRAHWGRGLATAAARAALDFGFDTAGLTRIIALVSPENHASKRVIEKLDFRFAKSAHLFGLDLLWYAMDREMRIGRSIDAR